MEGHPVAVQNKPLACPAQQGFQAAPGVIPELAWNDRQGDTTEGVLYWESGDPGASFVTLGKSQNFCR